MASSKEYFEFIKEQLSDTDYVSWRAMMGEYIIYYKGKVIAGIYDDRLLIKNTPSAKRLCPAAPLEIPYPGGRPMLLVENIENREFLSRLFYEVFNDL